MSILLLHMVSFFWGNATNSKQVFVAQKKDYKEYYECKF
jgi:hypothetical protein